MASVGPYEILGVLGEGAMGAVYRAKDPAIQRTLAIKIIKPALFSGVSAGDRAKLIDRFLREARAAGALSHPGIVTIYEAGEFQNVPYIAMEYVDGLTLEQVLKSGAGQAELLALLQQVALALDYAHS